MVHLMISLLYDMKMVYNFYYILYKSNVKGVYRIVITLWTLRNSRTALQICEFRNVPSLLVRVENDDYDYFGVHQVYFERGKVNTLHKRYY